MRTSENAPFSRHKWYGVESDAVTEDKGRAAILTETSLLMAVVFLGTNPVAVKLAVLDVPPCPLWRSGSSWPGLFSCPLRSCGVKYEKSGGRTCSTWRGWGSWAWQ